MGASWVLVAEGVLAGGVAVAAGAFITMGRWIGGASAMTRPVISPVRSSEVMARLSFHMRGALFRTYGSAAQNRLDSDLFHELRLRS